MVTVIDAVKGTDPRVYGGAMEPGGILLHHTGSRSEAGDQAWLQQYHANPVSAHKLFRRDGAIVKLVPDRRVAWHAGVSILNGRRDCNSFCLGYEICNAGDGKEKFTDEQYESVAQSVAYDCALYKIPDSWVSTHAAVALPAGRKNDPLGWDLGRMWKRVREIRQAWPYDIPMWCCNA